MKLKILYEDKNILAIDKPSGILVHSVPEQARYEAGPNETTIFEIFRKRYPGLQLVHRLDKETSGVLLLAKNAKTHEFFKKQFANRTVKKIYHTIVEGSVKKDHGIINKPIGRSPSDFRRRLSGRGAKGTIREAVTHYKVLKRFTSPQPSPRHLTFSPSPERRERIPQGKGESFTYLEVKPKTGRTHQIRVHMKFLNHPVACDSLYNPKGLCPKGFKRLALHAKSIEFKNLKGATKKVESPLPKEFRNFLI